MPAPTAAPDAELVRRTAAGELAAVAELYDRYGDRVHDHLARWSRDATLAADGTREAFVALLDEPGAGDGEAVLPRLLRTAREQVVDQLRRGQHELVDTPVATAVLAATRADPATPEVAALRHATAELVWEVAAGLDEPTFTVLDLHVRQGLHGAGIAAVTQTTPDEADASVDRMQEQVGTLFGAMTLLRLPTRDCPGLEALRRGAPTPLDPATAGRIRDHATGCITCGPRRARAAAPLPVYAALAPVRAPVAIRTGVMDVAAARFGTTSSSSRRGRLLPAGLALVLLLTVGGIASALRSNAPEPSDGPPTAAGSPVASPSPSPQPSPTETLEALSTASPTPSPSPEPTVTPEPTPSPSPTASPSPRLSPTELAVGIDRPAAGSVLPATAQDDQGRQAASVSVAATVTGGEATSVTWTSDRAPGEVLLATTEGELQLWLSEPCTDTPHLLTVTATDEQTGTVASATVEVLATETCAPALTVSIAEPSDGQTFQRDPVTRTVTFAVEGEASDDDVSWVWTTDRTAGEPVLRAQRGEVSVQIDDCTGSTTLRLTVAVEREDGSDATDDVTVNVDCGT